MINNQNLAVLSEKVAALEAAIKEVGTGLPSVTGSDNGKTLQVVGGEWDKGATIPEIQTLTYTGDGASSVEITFPKDPILIWINSVGDGGTKTESMVFTKESNAVGGYWFEEEGGAITGVGGDLLCLASYNTTTHKLTLSGGSDSGHRYNTEGKIATVYYI